MEKLRKEIEKWFAAYDKDGAYQLESIGDEAFPGWAYHHGIEYGVFIKYDGEEYSDAFSGAFIKTAMVKIADGVEESVLVLCCYNKEIRNSFAHLCADFVLPGDNGEQRKRIVSDPASWWKEWKTLLGNSQRNRMVYDVIGELMTVVKLLEEGYQPKWTAVRSSTHDIELEDCSYEVKSTVNKSASLIHVNNQFQLISDKPVYLIFNRMEESLTGDSINDIMKRIETFAPESTDGYNQYLSEIGYSPGNPDRKRKFKLLERRKYTVDESFPRITPDYFIKGKYPNGIIHVEYTVDLDGLEYEIW